MASEPFHGLLLVNKEPGGTSHDLVAQARYVLGTRSVGHSGTLDPMASGLMVLLVGEGTKLSNYILEGDKAYRATAKFGVRTDTLDTTGTVLSESPVDLTENQIREAALALQGDFDWEVPSYSAVKVAGKALHAYARDGEEVRRPVKRMSFWDVKIISVGPDSLQVDLRCSKGSFIRSWIKELGELLGCGAAMSALTRTESVPYELKQAKSMAEIRESWKQGRLPDSYVPMDQALPLVRRLRVKGADQSLLLNGQISHDLRSRLITQANPESLNEMVQIHSVSGQLLALVGVEPGKGFTIRRVFKYPA